MEHSEDWTRRRNERQSSAISTSSARITSGTDEFHMIDKSTNATYTKSLTISHDSNQANVKFFNNPLFHTKLQRHLSQTYDIQCSIELERNQIILTMIGIKHQVKSGCRDIKILFETTRTKIYNSETTDQKVDNSLQQLKDIESDYKNDNVQIRIRQKEFYAPQYRIEEIKQRIYELICQTIICSIQMIENSLSLIDDNNSQLNEIAKNYCCRIERIESKAEMQVFPIPKALTKTSSTPSLTIRQSDAFCSSLSVKKISVLNGSVEIYTADYSLPFLKDVTVVSTDAGALQEHIEHMHENGFFETPSGRKIVFCRWSHRTRTEGKASAKLKRSIGKFMSYVAQTITNNCPDAEKIAFSTCEWENFRDQSQFAEELIIEMKQVLELKRSRWRFLLTFNHEQSLLCKEFLQLCHTKPGVTGQFYSQTPIVSVVNQTDTTYEQAAFGHVSMKLQQVTDEQQKEREKTYKKQLKKQIENEKIPSDEIDILVGGLTLVVDDLEAILRGENPDDYMNPNDDKYTIKQSTNKYSKKCADDFLDCVKRWLQRAPNVIKKNVVPFTPTGDINDARLKIYRSTDYDWWKHDYETFDNLSTKDYFSMPSLNPGSWFTTEQAHDCFQLLIKTDKQANLIDTKLETNETAWDTVSISEVNNENATNDDDDIDDQWKTPEEIKKIQELDDPNRQWKRKKHVTEAFMKQKIRNIIEFQQFCNSQTNL
ncbi:unnamed protein product [Rotaria sp. Silwood2]|nr:unnamed protein product [Rotaria sp. Silwood2]